MNTNEFVKGLCYLWGKLPQVTFFVWVLLLKAALSRSLACVLFGLDGWRAMATLRLTLEHVLPVAEMGERRRAEAVSRTFHRFQNLLPSPTCRLFHWAKLICQQPTWVPGWITHLQDRTGTDAPCMDGQLGGPTFFGISWWGRNPSSALQREAARRRPAAQWEEQKPGSN